MLTARAADWRFWFEGKTIIGGLLGGTIAVEWMKARVGITQRTGDLFAVPIAVGIAVGRIGCFVAGLPDHTYGIATALPWGVDFGDGIARHPVQLYESVFALLLAAFLARFESRRPGDAFRVFLFAYLLWRLVIDFWKPGEPVLGLTTLQWACLAGALFYARDVLSVSVRKVEAAHGG